MKVIVAGYPKTGTKSMCAALRKLGYNVYDVQENMILLHEEYTKILRHGWTTDDFRKMYENVDAIMDVPACFFWDEIHKAFPEAKIVLTVRDDEDEWYKSLVKQVIAYRQLSMRLLNFASPTLSSVNKNVTNPLCMMMFGQTPQGPLELSYTMNEALIKKLYRAHNAYVMQTAPEDKLLIYRCSEGWEPLCKFLELPVPQEPFPHKNIGGNVYNEIQDDPIFKRIKREMMTSVMVLVTVTGAITYCSFKYGPINIAKSAFNHVTSAFEKVHFC